MDLVLVMLTEREHLRYRAELPPGFVPSEVVLPEDAFIEGVFGRYCLVKTKRRLSFLVAVSDSEVITYRFLRKTTDMIQSPE